MKSPEESVHSEGLFYFKGVDMSVQKTVFLVVDDHDTILGCYRKEVDALAHAAFEDRYKTTKTTSVAPYETRGKFDANIHA
jgi:hypothetical protein